MYKEKRNKILTILLFVQIGLVYFFSKFPILIELYYSNGIYKYVSIIFRNLFGWIPISVGDIIYFILIILIIRFLYKLITDKNHGRKQLIFQFLAGLSIFYFCFYLFWGLNYSRKPINHSLKLNSDSSASQTVKYDLEKLKLLTDKLITKVKYTHAQLTKNDTLPVVIPYTRSKIISLTNNGFQNLSNTFSQFKYESISIKKSLFSLPLTYMGFAGYFNPLTGEAQVDYLIPKINLPITCSHEVAHQLGIASENEANFVGFLAANFNDDLYFQYSANLFALRYALFDIYRSDHNIYSKYMESLPIGVRKNMKETDDFWKKYKNPAEPLFKYFYDNFLKYNQQEDGLESYSKMIDLLIAYENKYVLS